MDGGVLRVLLFFTELMLRRFDLNIAQAVIEQLLLAFDQEAVRPLELSVLNEVESEPGIYQLFQGDHLVYVGKADDSLRKRLIEHYFNLSSRQGIDVSQLGFKAMMVAQNWAPSAHETVLINHYRSSGSGCEWNTSGFGNHDPGRNRDKTITEQEHFDQMYPIRQDYHPAGVTAGTWLVRDLLAKIKDGVPFVFRYQADKNYRTGSPKYNSLSVVVPREGMGFMDLLQLVVEKLPPGWQVTLLPGRAIMYEETEDYAHALLTLRSRA